MPVISDKPLKRFCVRFWQEDMDFLRSLDENSGEPGVNKLIRAIVHSYVIQLKAKERERLDSVKTIAAK